MQISSAEQQEAVYFFQGDHLAKELLYSEFEAILDGFVPVTEYAGGLAKAVYLRINSQLYITAAVFFTLDFDEKGMINRRWNVPLQQLADASTRGPDLGAGPIRLACFSQCPIEWQRNNLWDPSMEPGRNSLVLLRKAVAKNGLGLIFKAPEESPASHKSTEPDDRLSKELHARYSQELRDRLAHVIKEQRFRITTLINRHKSKLRDLQREHQERLSHYQETLESQYREKEELEERNRSLKETLELQAQKIEGIREYFTHKLEQAQAGESSQLQALQENFALELETRIAAATAELQERLDMREVELYYRHQQESNLKEEIAHLRQENQRLLNQAGDQLLQKLHKAGINFVAFHPGVGQISIPVEDVAGYLDNPQAYAAANSGVSPAVYTAWLSHHQHPCCNHMDKSGQLCGKPLPKVATPTEFHPGESDRCSQHQLVTSQQRVAQYT